MPSVTVVHPRGETTRAVSSLAELNAYVVNRGWGLQSGNYADAYLTLTGQTYTPPVMDALGAVFVQGAGRPLKVVAGVLRNAGAASGYWQPIADTAHRSQNVDAVTTDNLQITVNFAGIKATKIAAFIAAPDETLANAGFTCGSSVTLTDAVIQIARTKPVSDYVTYSGTAWASTSGVFTPSFNAGVLTLTHADIGQTDSYDVSLTGRGGVYVPVITGGATAINDTQVKIEFRDWAGALVTTPDVNMKVMVSHGATGLQNPQLLDTTAFPGHNIWFIGVFEV